MFSQVQKKTKDIQDLLYYQFTNDDIDKVVKERSRFHSNPTNFAVAKTMLLKQKEDAMTKGDGNSWWNNSVKIIFLSINK